MAKAQKTEVPKVVTIQFPLRPVIFCPSCCSALEYGRLNNKTIVTHTLNGCTLAGKKFTGPVITLQEVTD